MRILKENEEYITISLNTTNESLAEDYVDIIKKICHSARLYDFAGLYQVKILRKEVISDFMEQFEFDFSKAERRY